MTKWFTLCEIKVQQDSFTKWHPERMKCWTKLKRVFYFCENSNS